VVHIDGPGLSQSSASLPSAERNCGSKYSFPDPHSFVNRYKPDPLQLEEYKNGLLSLQLKVNKDVDVNYIFPLCRISVQDF